MSITPEDSCISGTFATVAMPETPATDNGRGGVFSLSFLALVATQFFVSLNDNMFRWLVVPIGTEAARLRTNWPCRWEAACFILPFLVFAAPAGYLADRFSKRNVMVVCKVVEIVVLGLGIAAILLGNAYSDVRRVVLAGQSGVDVHHLEARARFRNSSAPTRSLRPTG